MTNLCFYFQVHQPYRLRKYTIFDIGKNKQYFDEAKNREVMEKVAKKCYLPANKIMLKHAKQYGSQFKIAYSITGTALEQMEAYAPEALQSFQELTDTGSVEMLNETYYHSLSFLFDKNEFREQIRMHQKAMQKYFGTKPKVFRNTELIYNNELAKEIEQIGYKTILAEGADHVLGNKSPNYVYGAKNADVKLLLKNYKLSDDIAFRFSDKNWSEHPVTAEKFANWCAPILGDSINLFMDYETFGEHQWEDTGIFKFLERLPYEIFKHKLGFNWPSEIAKTPAKEKLDIPNFVSWADIERDLSAWLANKMQNASANRLYNMQHAITENPELLEKWRKLTTSDHFYYMCTKWFSDGDVHKYFNPYESPYECYIAFMSVLNDMALRTKETTTKEWITLN